MQNLALCDGLKINEIFLFSSKKSVYSRTNIFVRKKN